MPLRKRKNISSNLGGSISEICRFIGSSETSHIPIIFSVYNVMSSDDRSLLLDTYPNIVDLLTYNVTLKDTIVV